MCQLQSDLPYIEHIVLIYTCQHDNTHLYKYRSIHSCVLLRNMTSKYLIQVRQRLAFRYVKRKFLEILLIKVGANVAGVLFAFYQCLENMLIRNLATLIPDKSNVLTFVMLSYSFLFYSLETGIVNATSRLK